MGHRRVAERPVTKTGRTIGRPRKNPPADAAESIEKMAASGWGVISIARALNVSSTLMRVWLAESEELREALDYGRERERLELHTKLREMAREGNVVALLFLLKSRHGYNDQGGEGETASRVSITFKLPAAVRPEQFVVEQPNDRNPDALPLSGASAVRS
jgi:transposase-like protein